MEDLNCAVNIYSDLVFHIFENLHLIYMDEFSGVAAVSMQPCFRMEWNRVKCLQMCMANFYLKKEREQKM
jgi:hypothetical protein